MNMEQMKEKASELMSDGDFSWFDSKENDMSIGMDWTTMQMVIVDMEHPDGPSIEAVGEVIDFANIYTHEEEK